jgi:hypothetical protein
LAGRLFDTIGQTAVMLQLLHSVPGDFLMFMAPDGIFGLFPFDVRTETAGAWRMQPGSIPLPLTVATCFFRMIISFFNFPSPGN